MTELAAALLSFVRGIASSPFSRRRSQRAAFERNYEAFLKAATKMAVVCEQEFREDVPASSPVGRGLSWLAENVVGALFSQRETVAMQRLLMPGKSRDLQQLRDEYIESSIALSRSAASALSRRGSHAVIEALQSLTVVVDRWAESQTNEHGMNEWVEAIGILKSAYQSALHPRYARRTLSAVARQLKRLTRRATSNPASLGAAGS
jgi:hypothetical protein